MLEFAVFTLGMVVGSVMIWFYFRRKHVGTLRIDTSDPSEGAYFFLEIKSGKAGSISNQKTILLSVSTEDYISHK